MTTDNNGFVARASKALSGVESIELKATLVSAVFVFIIMTSYYLRRAVRDGIWLGRKFDSAKNSGEHDEQAVV